MSSTSNHLPPITKISIALVSLLSTINFILYKNTYYLTLVPGRAFLCFWTIATANLVELFPISFPLNLFAFVLCGRYLERVYGSREFLKFCCLTGCLSMFAVFVFFLCVFAITYDMDHLYKVQANGLVAILCGFTVAFKHLVPEHTVKLLNGAVGIRVKHFPLINLCIQITWGLIAGHPAQVILSVTGLLVAWIYIRFVKVQNGIRGDRSETFSFASFFPDALQPPVKVVSKVVFNLMVLLRILRPIPTTAGAPFDLEGGLSMRPHVRQPLPGSDHSEAERRRALALRQLDIRLATSTPSASSAIPVSPTPNSPGTAKNTTPLPKPAKIIVTPIPSTPELKSTAGETAALESSTEEEKRTLASKILTNEEKDTG